ncbi:unnamed protein product [Gordionus sp. m RMFG-2023]|uniref:uncharacterized protein LOC135924389 n=1 Tax=Gordionus sp. m RMFG-2023 TaxID=3053472 RepID=UPI0030E0BBD0
MNKLYNDETKLKQNLFFKLIADPPTTTGQRLKALTIGSIPTFFEIKDSFDSKVISEDNIIYQLAKQGKKVIFLGDDTWISLYSSDIFYKIYPFPSFIVKDLHTVDNGILDNIFTIIKSNDWDIIIGHFLGVDHCGHWLGVNHIKMAEKLIQMDEFIRDLIQLMDNQTLIIVLGDHGSTNNGDHGGESKLEIESFLFAHSKQPNFAEQSRQASNPDVMFQIDLVPTLAHLLRFPIPYSSFGKTITQFFGNFPDKFTRNMRLAAMFETNIKQVQNIWDFHQLESRLIPSERIAIKKTYSYLLHLMEEIRNITSTSNFSNHDIVAPQISYMLRTTDAYIKESQNYLNLLQRFARKYWVAFDYVHIYLGLAFFVINLLAFLIIIKTIIDNYLNDDRDKNFEKKDDNFKYNRSLKQDNTKMISHENKEDKNEKFIDNPILYRVKWFFSAITVILMLYLTLYYLSHHTLKLLVIKFLHCTVSYALITVNICLLVLSAYYYKISYNSSKKTYNIDSKKYEHYNLGHSVMYDLKTEKYFAEMNKQVEITNKINIKVSQNNYMDCKGTSYNRNFLISDWLWITFYIIPSISLFSNSYVIREFLVNRFALQTSLITLGIIKITSVLYYKARPIIFTKLIVKTFFPVFIICFLVRVSLTDHIYDSAEQTYHLFDSKCRSETVEAGICQEGNLLRHAIFGVSEFGNQSLTIPINEKAFYSYIITLPFLSFIWGLILSTMIPYTCFKAIKHFRDYLNKNGKLEPKNITSNLSLLVFFSLFIYWFSECLKDITTHNLSITLSLAFIQYLTSRIIIGVSFYACILTPTIIIQEDDNIHLSKVVYDEQILRFNKRIEMISFILPVILLINTRESIYQCCFLLILSCLIICLRMSFTKSSTCAMTPKLRLHSVLLYAFIWFSLSNFAFFLTHHQNEISAIKWHSAFEGMASESMTKFDSTMFSFLYRFKSIISSEPNRFISAYLIILNTFSSQILLTLMFPIFTNSPIILSRIYQTNIDALESTYSTIFITLSFIKIFCCTVCIFIHRRHLMLWAIFFPRFIYALVEYLLVVLISIFSITS